MATFTNPTDIARETLKLLAARRLLPTPENYQKIYGEIAGVAPQAPQGEASQALLKVLEKVGRQSPALGKRVKPLENALAGQDWASFESSFAALVGAMAGEGQPAWGELISDLLRQWQIKHKGLTTKRKQEGLERVLITFAADPAQLHQKVRALIDSWSGTPAQEGVEMQEVPAEAATEAVKETAAAPARQQLLAELGGLGADVDELLHQLREFLAQALERGVAPRLTQFPDLSGEAAGLAGKVREAREPQAIDRVGKELKQFWFKLELAGESDSEVLAGLLRLLKLLVDNIGELLVDDQWMRGQIAVVQDIISHPIDSRALFEAERSFKEVIFKQGTLKQSLQEAKSTLKNMVTTFIDRLGDMSESTGGYHDKIEAYAARITQTEDIHQLNEVLADMSKETRSMQLDMQRSRDDLIAARKQVEAAEERIRKLEKELEEASEKVREDQLTGTLNRRGLTDAMEREMARSDRSKSPLCLALLDLDHFKKLNDTYGHQTGDEALLHLVKVVKEALRPMDVIARFGGEEFIILLPDTGLNEAVKVMARVQRELTKKFFLHKNERLLITFSAGVALRGPAENAEAVIERADRAVYQAKQTGRNRVVAAE